MKREDYSMDEMLAVFQQVVDGYWGNYIAVINDYTYEPGKCTDGGRYSYVMRFYWNDGVWEVEHACSSSFTTCPCCGNYVSDGDTSHEWCVTQRMTADDFYRFLCSIDWNEDAKFVDGKSVHIYTESHYIF